ncbi:MAG: putative CRISPR-associated protein [Pseudomonadota bacterium]
MTQPGTLICTVGTSLFYPNMKHLNPETYYRHPPRDDDLPGLADWKALEGSPYPGGSQELKSLAADLKNAYESEDHGRLAGLLVELPPEVRLCGAEINSIDAMVRKGFLGKDRFNLVLLVSDTREGAAIGQVLSGYFQEPGCRVGFEKCHVETVAGLQDEQPLLFQREGLPNLVRLLGAHYRTWGGAVSVNATGGYKAQIALAVAFGQAVGLHVYYKHERFDQVVRFPKIPFTLDLSPVKDHLKLWADLAEPGASVDRGTLHGRLSDNPDDVDMILPLLDSLEEGSSALYVLSALGMVYWEAFRSLNPDAVLEPAKVTVRRGCRFRDDNFPIGFKDHVERFFQDFPDHVGECHSLPYSGQAAIRTGFFVRGQRIVGEYLDRNHFGARFEIMTAAENQMEREGLVQKFNQWL